MSQVFIVAKDEWRYWLRSKLALWSVTFFLLLLAAVGTLNVLKVSAEQHNRSEHQKTAEATFLAQPDRHPHRMVHYGHYAFRAPSPLAVLDPGLDAVTGQSIFLEGHRQNTAAFNESGASADLGGLSWLSPALIYQWFAPLLLVLLGYGAVVREREASTLATLLLQNVSGITLLLGKLLALIGMSVVLLLPLWVTAVLAEGVLAGSVLAAIYWLYLGIWATATVLVSAMLHKRAAILAAMSMLWLAVCLLIPSLAVELESQADQGKIASDLNMLADLRKLGDGHNSNDPAFAQIRANLLAQYEVEKVEDLPVNLRGIVAQYSEQKLTQVLNAYANERMSAESKQAAKLQQYGWLSPPMAIAGASRAVAGTDLYHYHQFLLETESLRYNFVQGLNDVHAKQLAYQDDINRSSDQEAEKRTRISSDNWQVLDSYQFEPAPFNTRLNNAKSTLIMLLAWLGALVMGIFFVGRSMQP